MCKMSTLKNLKRENKKCSHEFQKSTRAYLVHRNSNFKTSTFCTFFFYRMAKIASKKFLALKCTVQVLFLHEKMKKKWKVWKKKKYVWFMAYFKHGVCLMLIFVEKKNILFGTKMEPKWNRKYVWFMAYFPDKKGWCWHFRT